MCRILFYCWWLPVLFSGSCSLLALYVNLLLSLLLILLSLFGILDGICRTKEALKLKDRKIGIRHFNIFKSSRCQRNMIIGVVGRRARLYFKKIGYRWYHLLPDILLKKPLTFFHPNFIRKTFIP